MAKISKVKHFSSSVYLSKKILEWIDAEELDSNARKAGNIPDNAKLSITNVRRFDTENGLIYLSVDADIATDEHWHYSWVSDSSNKDSADNNTGASTGRVDKIAVKFLQEQIAAVRELHQAQATLTIDRCRNCKLPSPCPTIQALDGDWQ